MEQTYSANASEIQMDTVPAGENRNVMVTGIKGQVNAWRGQARGLTVAEGSASEVSLLLTKVADLTCTTNAMSSPRAFAASVLLSDGRILVAGGIGEDEASTTCTPAGGVCRMLAATGRPGDPQAID
jgi:hypothetical protein